MNIILIGIGGSGKSTVGKLLANKLDKKFFEMDKIIEKKVNMSIPQIVEKFGWDKFRDCESQVVDDLCKLNNTVISSGGGVVIREENISKLKANGILIWLRARIDTLAKRIGDGKSRPILSNPKNIKKELKQIYDGRKKLYQKAADCNLNTDSNTPEEIADKIIKYLKDKKYD